MEFSKDLWIRIRSTVQRLRWRESREDQARAHKMGILGCKVQLWQSSSNLWSMVYQPSERGSESARQERVKGRGEENTGWKWKQEGLKLSMAKFTLLVLSELYGIQKKVVLESMTRFLFFSGCCFTCEAGATEKFQIYSQTIMRDVFTGFPRARKFEKYVWLTMLSKTVPEARDN